VKPISLLLIALWIVSPLFAQQDAAKPAEPAQAESGTPLFTTGTEFVQVPVIVQRGGKHVPGLKKENFVLRQDGKDQALASFEEIHRGEKPPEVVVPGQAVVQAPQQITIIALDMVNTPNLDRAYFNEQIQRYLSRPNRFPGPIALVAIERNGIRVMREFTTDPKAILSAFKKESTKPTTANNDADTGMRQQADQQISMAESYGGSVGDELKLREASEDAARFQDRSARIDTQLAIQQLAQGLKGIPGRKSVLLVGSGFSFIDTKTVLRMIGNQERAGLETAQSVENASQTLDQAAYTWKLLNDANVAVYPIDTRRTYNSAAAAFDVSGVNTPSSLTQEQYRQTDRDILDSFKTIANETGGKPCFYRTDLDNCVREAVDDDHDYYLLGFYVDKNNRKPGWHKIEVKLNEKGNIRYRRGFILAKFNPDEQRKTDIALALRSPFAYTDLMIKARFDDVQSGPEGKKLVPFHIMIPPGGIVPEDAQGRVNFDIIAIARSEGGKQAGDFTQHVDRKFPIAAIQEIKTTGVDYKNNFELPAGEYAVWFVVRDNVSGRTGSSVVRLKVP
jgi:VWFA-related protein